MPDSPSNNPPDPLHKESRVQLRIDKELETEARQKAARMGWSLSAVMRSLLALWVKEDVVASSEVGQAAQTAPKRKRKRKAKKD